MAKLWISRDISEIIHLNIAEARLPSIFGAKIVGARIAGTRIFFDRWS